MKKIILMSCVSLFIVGMNLIPINAESQTNNVDDIIIENTLSANEIAKESNDEFEIQKISRDELVERYARRYNVDIDEAFVLVNRDFPMQKAIDTDYYVITKQYSLKFITGGNIGTTVKHQVVVSMYSDGSFLEIRDAADCAVLVNGTDYSWEDGINTQNHTAGSVSWFSTGNLVFTTSQSLGVAFGPFFSGSVGNEFYYRKYFELESEKVYY